MPIAHSIKTLQFLTDKWPTRDDILNTTDHPTTSIRTKTPPPDQLPHGLDRITPTPTHARTRDGAEAVIYNIRALWQRSITGKTPTTTPNYDNDLAWLHANKHHLTDLHPSLAEATTRRLAQLTQEAENICGYGTEKDPRSCPNCHGQLHRPYTHTGIADYATCTTCHHTYTTTELDHRRRAQAHHAPALVTASQAATILGLTPATITQRIKRGHLKPATRIGKRRYYQLNDIAQPTKAS